MQAGVKNLDDNLQNTLKAALYYDKQYALGSKTIQGGQMTTLSRRLIRMKQTQLFKLQNL
jgi:hypothetical protein